MLEFFCKAAPCLSLINLENCSIGNPLQQKLRQVPRATAICCLPSLQMQAHRATPTEVEPMNSVQGDVDSYARVRTTPLVWTVN